LVFSFERTIAGLVGTKKSIVNMDKSSTCTDSRYVHGFSEFLTNWTTCTNEIAKKTTCEKYCQKEPLLGSGTSGQATHGTRRLGQSRQEGAAIPKAGMFPGR
jgi:hypothetical protein